MANAFENELFFVCFRCRIILISFVTNLKKDQSEVFYTKNISQIIGVAVIVSDEDIYEIPDEITHINCLETEFFHLGMLLNENGLERIKINDVL